jgi:fibronectin type 3 domain-containing protein
MTAPSGKTFNGWVSGGTPYAEGSSYTVTGNVTFTAQWTGGGGTDPDDRGFLDILYGEASGTTGSNEGVYVGIISFAGDATVITSPPILLNNAANYNTLKSKIANDYTRATQGGTTMFLGVHRALADLKANETSYPANLDTVSIITFTDGLDNQSHGMLSNSANSSGPNYQLEGQSFPTVVNETTGEVTTDGLTNYINYVKGQIANRTIAGKTIKAYSVGILGSDLKNPSTGIVSPDNQALFNSRLEAAATTGTDPVSGNPYFTQLSDFDQLKATFRGIAEGLNVVYTNTTITMTTTQNAGARYRWTFDAAGKVDAESSTRYIEATLSSSGSEFRLVAITYAGGISADQGSGPIIGTMGTEGLDFEFTNVQNYDSTVDRTNTQQWLRPAGSTTWNRESEINTTGVPNSTVEHKTAVIYLVLDASTSLSESEIASIKAAISSGSYSSGPGGSAPSAPTGVNATAASSSSITVTWNTVSNATGYTIYRSGSASGNYSQVGTSSTTSYTNTGLQSDTTYYYKVSATNANGTSSQSAYTSAKTQGGGGGGQAPGAPTGVSAFEAGAYIFVQWNEVSGAEYYTVYRSEGSAAGHYQAVSDADGSYTDWDIIPGISYYYKVTAVNDYGESVQSASAGPVTIATVPNVPTGLNATSPRIGTIEVSWDSVSGATSYNVYSSISANGEYSFLKTVFAPVCSDSGWIREGYVYYKVTAINSAGESEKSSYVEYHYYF